MELFITDLSSLSKQPEETAAFLSVLSPEEQVRYSKMTSAKRRQEFLVGRALIRDVLSSFLGQKASDIPLGVQANGAPYLKTGALYFNLSHSGSFLLLGVDETPLGVDIERMKYGKAVSALAKEVLDVPALDTFLLLAPSEQAPFFYRAWTMKEAALKLEGVMGKETHLLQLGQKKQTPVHFYSGRYQNAFFAVAKETPLRTLQLVHKIPLLGTETFISPEDALLS